MKNFIINSTGLLAVIVSAIALQMACWVAKKKQKVSVVGLTTEELKFFNFEG